MTFWTRAERTPPILVRLLARRKHGPPLSNDEIATISQVPLFQVNMLSCALDWSCCDVLTMRRYLEACQVDFENGRQMERIDGYLRVKPTWQYLRKSPDWPYFECLMRRYQQFLTTTPIKL